MSMHSPTISLRLRFGLSDPSGEEARSMKLLNSLLHRSSELRRRRIRLNVERLEDRTVPSITFSGPGNSGLASVLGGAGAEQFMIRLKPGDAATLELSDNGGASFVDAAIAGITAVNVSGFQGNDTLIVDASNGILGLPGGLPVSFDGGGGRD